MEEGEGLRERKKVATREALHRAAVRLAGERGFDHVTVEGIADAAGVSRRTFSNYFAGKEEAFFHGDAQRAHRLLELVCAAPAAEQPWDVLAGAADELLAEAGEEHDPRDGERRHRLRAEPGLLAHAVGAYAAVERELAAELAGRLTGEDAELRSRVLAATFLAALRVGVDAAAGRLREEVRATVRSALAAAAPADGRG